MGLASATESYAASALYATLASLSGALWRIRQVSFTIFVGDGRRYGLLLDDLDDFLDGLESCPYRRSVA